MATFAVATAAQAANLVQNGGFESGAFTDNSGGFGYDQINGGGTDLANWTVGNSLAWGLNAVDINVNSGVGYVDLTGIGTNFPNYGQLSQSLTTVANQKYSFSIYATTLGSGSINVFAGGNGVALTGVYGTYGGAGGTTWGLLTGSFTATGASTLLEILGAGDQTFVIGLDDVSVFATGVPEPATWALMLLGFGGLGLALRNRRVLAAQA